MIIYKKCTLYGKIYKGSTPANQNQPDETTDIVIDTNKTICPEFDLAKLTCDYYHVLSIDETETYLSFNVSPELGKEYEKFRGLEKAQEIHTMRISDIAKSAWLIDFCHKAIVALYIILSRDYRVSFDWTKSPAV